MRLVAPRIDPEATKVRGFTREDLSKVERRGFIESNINYEEKKKKKKIFDENILHFILLLLFRLKRVCRSITVPDPIEFIANQSIDD